MRYAHASRGAYAATMRDRCHDITPPLRRYDTSLSMMNYRDCHDTFLSAYGDHNSDARVMLAANRYMITARFNGEEHDMRRMMKMPYY